ncbi:hypothetical protein AA0112_g11473 [Alternaria arborescens]|uniref:hypothetical protein n=1 Tax=Alternaria arborescens TaxID=156630 RepID=UPI001074F573|nr:hypothetical protein AA0111_g9804 [Alternaria arborescens]RYN18569.1 hypothetical protein AA0112_g11473 [Alternaria arborescens]RYO21209.1 hypothetical protein AA0111_g9804 [Alternaria arborescens]
MAPQKEVVLRLASMRYLKAGVSEEDFHEYSTNYHAPKAAIIQARHGALRVSQIHSPTALRNLFKEKLPWVVRPGWKVDDHDISVAVWVRTSEQMQAIVTDPDFQSLIAGDDKIIDVENVTVTAGWEEVYIEDGKIVNIEDGKSLYPPFAECVKVGDLSVRSEVTAEEAKNI